MTVVIGLGNRDRGDDAAGLLVAADLQDRVPQGVTVLQLEGDPLRAIGTLQIADRVLLVDALAAAGNPGSVHRFEAGREPMPSAPHPSSTHLLGAGELVQLATAVGWLPEVTVYGIEGVDFQPGHGVTALVEEGVRTVVASILRELP